MLINSSHQKGCIDWYIINHFFNFWGINDPMWIYVNQSFIIIIIIPRLYIWGVEWIRLDFNVLYYLPVLLMYMINYCKPPFPWDEFSHDSGSQIQQSRFPSITASRSSFLSASEDAFGCWWKPRPHFFLQALNCSLFSLSCRLSVSLLPLCFLLPYA